MSGDEAKPAAVLFDAPGTVEELSATWDRFRAGGPAPCARGDAAMALAVDAAAGAYRFVCTACGRASPWFESSVDGLKIRGGVDAFAPPLADD